jgi:hypothetical protein
MEFWEQVEKSDPKYVKEVNLGRTFNAIDPMYQIRNATKHMGVCGKGWGYEVIETLFLPIDCVAVRIRLWKDAKENFVEQWGQCKLFTDKNKAKPDYECMKKATTDGVTKCLSLLGFNADVFLNKFADSKYIEELNQQAQQEEREQKAQSFADDLMNKINKCKDERDVVNLETDNAKKINNLKKYETIDKAVAQCITDKKASFVQSPTEAMQ